MMDRHVEWNEHKASRNLNKHQVSFDEAATVSDDPLFISVVDEEHSIDEERYITIGLSNRVACYWLHMLNAMISFGSAVLVKRRNLRNSAMQTQNDADDYELREEYDLSKMTVMPRGRYAPERRTGKNVVVLAPDVVGC